MFEDSLEEIELPINPHDIFVFSSDGVNEAMNEENQLFGYDQLTEILKTKSNLSSNDIVDNTMLELEKFRGLKDPNDDITMVVMKVQ